MKFGAQLRNKSVPEWRSYNIDYNDLKLRIRATTELPSNEKALTALYASFIEQIDHVNMFLGSKLGEVQRRMSYVENCLEAYDEDGSLAYDVEANLKRLSSDLQKLSRFIVVQKTALRKLLKKYTKYSNDHGALNMRVNKYVVQDQDSFIHVDLHGFYLELTLLYDLVREKQQDRTQQERAQQTAASRQRRASRVDPVMGLNANEVFDFESIRKGNTKQTFLVHYDNLVEFKLFLLSNFSLVDESVQHERRALQLHRQKSQMSFRELIHPRNNSQDDLSRRAHDAPSNTYTSNSIYINNADDLTYKGLSTTIILDDPKHLQSIQMSTDPGSLTMNEHYRSRKLLISAIGGIRKSANVLLEDDAFTDDLLKAITTEEPFDTFQARHTTFFASMDSLKKISIEWLFSRHIKPITKVHCTRTRFKPVNTESSKLETWITLSSNIKLSSVDLNVPSWTENNEKELKDCDYALFEVRFSSAVSADRLPEELSSLLDSHLIHKVDSSLTMLTYHLYITGQLKFTPVWAPLFGEKPMDIRKNPPKVRRTKSAKSTVVSDVSTKHGSVSGDSSQFKYWNEFDNGSDTERGDGFYIDVDSDGDTLFPSSGVEYLFKISEKMNAFLHDKMPLMFDKASVPLLHDNHRYGSVEQSDVESLDEAVSHSKAAHDVLLVFLAVSCSLMSLLLISVSLGIIVSLLEYDDARVGPLVVATLIVAMLVSLFFSVVSLCFLMMSDAENRKTWQTGFVWTVFFTATVMIMYGMVEAFYI